MNSAWLVRGIIAVCLLMVVLLQVVSLEPGVEIQDETAVYTPPRVLNAVFGVIALVTATMAVFYWRAGAWHNRLLAGVLAIMACFVSFHLPTGFNHSLTVTPDAFELKSGPWYATTTERVTFAQLEQLAIVEADDSTPQSPRYAIQCTFTDEAPELAIRLNDLAEAALPRIVAEADRHDVAIADVHGRLR